MDDNSSSLDINNLLEELEDLQSEEDTTSLYTWVAFGLSILAPTAYMVYKGMKRSSCSSKCCGASLDIQMSRKDSSPTLHTFKLAKNPTLDGASGLGVLPSPVEGAEQGATATADNKEDKGDIESQVGIKESINI